MHAEPARFEGLWGWMQVLCTWLLDVLRWLAGITGSWGLAIILLAVLVRLVLFPFARRALYEQKRFNEAHQRLEPELKEIKANYRGAEQAERLDDLYRAHKLNPAAGMKPLLLVLVQLPILVALFQILLHAPELRGVGFLGIADLSQADHIAPLGTTLPWFGSYLNLLPFVLAGTLVLGAMFVPGEHDPAAARKRLWITSAMALVFFVLFYTFPAGLVIYWIATNLLASAQQVLVARRERAKA
jgi:YidC/Oxa1 family membrane protein insertase